MRLLQHPGQSLRAQPLVALPPVPILAVVLEAPWDGTLSEDDGGHVAYLPSFCWDGDLDFTNELTARAVGVGYG